MIDQLLRRAVGELHRPLIAGAQLRHQQAHIHHFAHHAIHFHHIAHGVVVIKQRHQARHAITQQPLKGNRQTTQHGDASQIDQAVAGLPEIEVALLPASSPSNATLNRIAVGCINTVMASGIWPETAATARPAITTS